VHLPRDGLSDAGGEDQRHDQLLVRDPQMVGHAEQRAGHGACRARGGAATMRRIRAFSSFTAMA
jgi:hypothetical protein